MDRQQCLQSLLESLVTSPLHKGVALSVYDVNLGREDHFSAGNLDERRPFFATGITKLYVATIMMQLLEEGKVILDRPFVRYLPGVRSCLELHVKDGYDYTDKITLRHLMAQLSGLGDNFVFARSTLSSRKFRPVVVNDGDQSWTFEDAMMRARSNGGLFEPGQSKRAIYADTNFYLLGKVIETIEQKDFRDVVKARIVRPLGLGTSYIYSDPSDKRPAQLMLGEKEVQLPRLMSSLQSEAGLVTSTREALIFLRAFFEGYLFDKALLNTLMNWHPYTKRFFTGLGMHRLALPFWKITKLRLQSPATNYFSQSPEMVGHMGWTSCFALFDAKRGHYITGTLNQLREVELAAQFAFKVMDILESSASHRLGSRAMYPAQ